MGKKYVSLKSTDSWIGVGTAIGANASVNRMGTFPQVTRRWWVEEYEELRQKQRDEVEAETQVAFKLAKERGERFKKQLD